jgi:hypothetical protein
LGAAFILEKSFILVDHFTGQVDQFLPDCRFCFAGLLALFHCSLQSIDMNTRSFDYTTHAFTDKTAYVLKVINKLPIDITITADNYIDNNGSMELFIEKDKEATAVIYTNRPVFTSNSSYPVLFDWVFIDNEISVIIR